MSIQFEFYETPNPSGEGEAKHHVRAVTLWTVGTEKIIDEIHESSTLTPADVKAALESLSHVLAKHLGNSERVHLEGIGYFQPTLKASREIDVDKTRAQSVWFKSIKFRADQKLKNKLINIQTERADFKRHSTNLTPEQIDSKLTDYFQSNQLLTRRLFQFLCGMTQITAARHIKRLKEEGKIKNIGTQRQPAYVPAPGFYGAPAETPAS